MIDIPESMKKGVLADWIEAVCLFGGDEFVSDVVIGRFLDAHNIEPEDRVLDIRSEINLRHFIGRESHPVTATPDGFRRTHQWTDNPAYAFQLLLALKEGYKSARIVDTRLKATAKLFERLVTLALKGYLQGNAINVGHQRNPEISSFSKCLDCVCGELDEIVMERRLYTPDTKDDLVDVVAWRRFEDKRPGQVVILAGCTIGADLQNKATEIMAGREHWKHHIDWTVVPLTAFAFPYVCLDGTEWQRLSQVGGVLLDRLRITFMFMSIDGSELRTQLTKWCEDQLPRLPWLQS